MHIKIRSTVRFIVRHLGLFMVLALTSVVMAGGINSLSFAATAILFVLLSVPSMVSYIVVSFTHRPNPLAVRLTRPDVIFACFVALIYCGIDANLFYP